MNGVNKHPIHWEEHEQTAVVRWCDLMGVPIYAIPNGGSRNRIEAANLKRSGVKAGVPDLCVPLARCGAHGLYIEMKRRDGKNKPTAEQKAWIARLNENGYIARVCYGADEAIRTITAYLKGVEQCKT